MSTPPDEVECPECGEMIDQNGVLKNPNTGDTVPSYACEMCKQSYAYRDSELFLTPFDHKGVLIEIECNRCGVVHNTKADLIHLCDDKFVMKPYCSACAYESASEDEEFLSWISTDLDNVDLEPAYAMFMTEKVESDPEKLRFALENQRSFWREVGLSDEKISERIEAEVAKAKVRANRRSEDA